ncbi:MAG TPA: putative Ig domain-containing protein [Bryobacteraceae bacterium]|nr:putative Ig domain-containing protein [Bryobacteraceae bacterium]
MPGCWLSIRTTSVFILLAVLSGAFAPAQTPPAVTVTVTTAKLPAASVGAAYSVTLTASGGTAPYTWKLDGFLPAGLTLSPAGVLSGVPSTPYTQPVTFSVTAGDAKGNTSAVTPLSIVVNPQGLTITTPSPLPSGIATVEYPARLLTATGGVSPFLFSVSSGLPPGMNLSTNGLLGGTPTLAGTYEMKVTVTDAANSQAAATLAITIRQATTDLQLSEGSLSFTLSEAAGSPPSAKSIKVQSSLVSEQLAFTVSVSPAVTWLSVSGGSTTPASIQAAITDAALPLGPATYATTINITCQSAPCSGKAETVPVTLTVTPSPPKLKVLNDVLSYETDASLPLSSQTLSQPLLVRNTGGGSLAVNSISCDSSWCTVAAPPAAIQGGVTSPVNVNLNPASLSPGSYRANVTVNSGAGSAVTPIALVVPRKPSMRLGSAGGQFTMPAGGAPEKPTGSFRLVATGGTVSWTATASATPAWLAVTTPSGTATPSLAATVQFSINDSVAAGLAPGTYYGTIEMAANGVTNSPQNYRVILNVAHPQDPVRPELDPGGIVLTTTTLKTVTGTTNVLAGSTAALTYQAAVNTSTGGSWLSVSPSVGTASSSSPGVSTITANPAGLAAGVYSGTVSYAFSGADVRTLNVTLVVTSPSSGSTKAPAASAAADVSPKVSCSPSTLAIGQTGLANNFSEPTSWPVPVAINLLDDCGDFVSGAQVVATFSSGDPPLTLPLVDGSTGLYAATWVPRHTSSSLVVTTTATAPGLPVATATLAGEVLPNVAPSLNAYAVLNVFNPQVGGALAPGTVVALYGSGLASAAAQPAALPLPTSVNGTQVIVGGIAAPLYYTSSGQINAQIPFELDAESQYDVVISANGALTTPQAIQLTPASPGVAANSDTTIIAEHANGALITSSSPAQPGETIVVFLAGMGATNVNVASGSGSPSNPLAQMPTSSGVSVTVDSTPASIGFAGLTPGAVGLYQINFRVPSSMSNGNHQLTVSQASGAASNSTLLPVHN